MDFFQVTDCRRTWDETSVFRVPNVVGLKKLLNRRIFIIRSLFNDPGFSRIPFKLDIFISFLSHTILILDILHVDIKSACCNLLLSYSTHALSGHPENKHSGFLVAGVFVPKASQGFWYLSLLGWFRLL